MHFGNTRRDACPPAAGKPARQDETRARGAVQVDLILPPVAAAGKPQNSAARVLRFRNTPKWLQGRSAQPCLAADCRLCLCMNTELLSAPSEAPVACGPLRPRWITATRQLAELDGPWQTLAQGIGPIEQFAWSQTCAETIAADQQLAILALEADDRCLALAPLVRKRRRGFRRLCQLGVGELHEPMDLPAANRQALAGLARALVRLNEPLWLERLPVDSPAVAAIERAFRGRAIVVRRPQANCPYITLDESWLEPEKHLNSGRRSDLRRSRRKADQLGEVTTEILTPSAADVDRLFDEAVAIEARSWKGEAGTALAHDQRRAAFYQHYVRRANDEGTLRLCFLRIGGRPAAMQVAIEQGRGFSLLKVGYDAEFSACSPGLLLMRDTIRYAAQAGLASYEFLGRAEAWTAVWTNQERQTVSLRIYPYRALGLAALGVDAVATLVARWRKS
jgi:CelD/BcsL family acetyltransferase involved in cellulose biosynthesis